jgi:hypothetical protein
MLIRAFAVFVILSSPLLAVSATTQPAGNKTTNTPIDEHRALGASRGTVPDDKVMGLLAQKIENAVFPEGTTFEQVIDSLQERGKLHIRVNWNALHLVGIERSDRISLNVHSAKFETILTIALEDAGAAHGIIIAYKVVDGGSESEHNRARVQYRKH